MVYHFNAIALAKHFLFIVGRMEAGLAGKANGAREFLASKVSYQKRRG